MSTEQKEQNALAASLAGFWTKFKQGKIIGYKWMALILILVAAIGVTWYILANWKASVSKRWMDEEEANTIEKQEEISKQYPGTIQDKIARLQIARGLLGESGIELLGANNAELRNRGVANIEKSREMFQQLVEDFKNDPVFKAQCLLGLAKAEAALVAVPAAPGQLTEFKGKLPKVVEYLDQLAETAAPNSPWATDSKKLADALRNELSPTAEEFKRIQRDLFTIQSPVQPKLDDPLFPTPTGGGPAPPGGGFPTPNVPIIPK